jgi:hypothetical protein
MNTRKDRNHASHVDARVRICKAGMELAKRKVMPSRRKIGATLRRWKLPGPSEHTWQAWLAEIGEKWGEVAMTVEFWHGVAQALVDENAELPAEATMKLLDKFARDAHWQVRKSVASSPKASPELLTELSQDEDWHVRSEVADNEHTPPEALEMLTHDPEAIVRTVAEQKGSVDAR